MGGELPARILSFVLPFYIHVVLLKQKITIFTPIGSWYAISNAETKMNDIWFQT